MTLKQKAAKGILWSFIQRWGSQLISFSVFLLLARLLGPEDFGLIALSGVFIAFMKVFLDQGFAAAIVQRKTVEQEHLDTAFWVSIGTSLLLVAIACSSAGWIADFYHEPQLAPVIRFLSINFVFKALNSVQNAILTRKLAFKTLAVRSLIGIAGGGSVGVIMALSGFGVWSLVGYQLANSIIEVPILWAVTDWRPGLRCSRKHFRELFDFGIHVIGMNGLVFLNNYSDNLLIGYYLGATALGYYTVAYRVLTVLTTLLAKTTNQVAFPTFSKLQQEPERLERAYYKATHLTSLISFPAFLGIVALAPELVPTVFGEQWAPTIPVMQTLAFIGILRTVFQFNGPIMMAMGRPDWRFKINIMNTVLNVTCFFAVVKWGILAVAIAFVIRSYAFAPVGLWLIKKLIKINLKTYLQQFQTPLIASLVMVGVILGLKQVLITWVMLPVLLGICIGIGCISYGLTVAYFEPNLSQELYELGKIILPKSKKKKAKNT
ncbi:MAG: MOP flippase family protein [Cyanobacteria bacterium P01_E01_bin.6]